MILYYANFGIVLALISKISVSKEISSIENINYKISGALNLNKINSMTILDTVIENSNADPCNPNPCQNNQPCKVEQGKVKCKCRLPYKGERCEISPCYPNNPCENGGNCTIKILYRICNCFPGYNGDRCTRASCDSKVCKNGGTCTIVKDKINCKCSSSFSGPYCEAKQACDCENGHCIRDSTGKMQCVCRPEYGKYSTSRCKVCECGRGANCTFDVGLFTDTKTCICSRGSTEIDGVCVNPCDKSPCLNGGTCQPYGKEFKCVCKSPYNGTKCEISPCTKNPCQNGGSCDVEKTGFSCKCITPYTGNTCQIDPCKPNPCQNGGTCKTVERNFKCECKDHYEGDKCDIECDCENGHCKKNSSGIVVCECLPEFGLYSNRQCKACDCGKKANCTFDVSFLSTDKYCLCPNGDRLKKQKCKDPCANNVCKNGGTCQTYDGINANCTCTNLYSGKHCEIDPCTSNPCLNGGTCSTDEKTDYVCSCELPYSGNNCEIDPCTPNPCENGGTCKIIARNFKCDCKDHYEGDKCDVECHCEHGHCKRDSSGKVVCECLPEFGLYSDRQCKACECGKKANCSFDVGFFSTNKFCLCPNGEKLKLQKCKDPCANNPCKNGGTCQTDDGINVICTCTNLYTGKHCEIGTVLLSTSTRDLTTTKLNELSSTPQLKTKIPSSTFDLLQTTSALSSSSDDLLSTDDSPYSSTTFKSSTQKFRETTETFLSSSVSGCDCGKYSISCKYNSYGEKECLCTAGFFQFKDICIDCSCGFHSIGCYFDKNLIKVCLCEEGYEQRNSVCSAECQVDCVYGECKALGDKYSCRCHEEFTGSRCEIQIPKFQGTNYLMIIAIMTSTALVIIMIWIFYSVPILCRLKYFMLAHERK